MNNKGITLIELMISIALLGIIFASNGFFNLIPHIDKQEKIVLEQDKIFKFQKKLNDLLSTSKKIIKVTNTILVTDNLKLVIGKNGNKMLLNNELFYFNRYKIYDLKKENDLLVSCRIRNMNYSYKTYLIPYKGNSLYYSVYDDQFIKDESNTESNDLTPNLKNKIEGKNE